MLSPAVDNLVAQLTRLPGIGTRTAQRWERELGLPVHRIGHDGGEIVYAFRSEIDSWSRRAASPQNWIFPFMSSMPRMFSAKRWSNISSKDMRAARRQIRV